MNTAEIKFKLGRDVNGNKLVKVTRKNYRGFSIQSNGNLPLTHSCWTINNNITLNEVQVYVEQFGTEQQKSLMGIGEDLKES